MKDKVFYSFIMKHFSQQLHNYFTARIPEIVYGPGSTVPLNKQVHVVGSTRLDKNGVLHGRTTEKHYWRGWNDCSEEMRRRIITPKKGTISNE